MQKNSATISSSAHSGYGNNTEPFDAARLLRNEHFRLRYALTEVKLENLLRQIGPKLGRKFPALHRWPRTVNGSLEIPPLNALKSNVAALRLEIVLCQLAWRERKAGFDENEPRRQRGEDGAGEWTDEGGGSGKPQSITDAPDGDRAPLRITIHPRPTGDGSTDGSGLPSDEPPIEEPPEVPAEEPATPRALNNFIKQAAYWLAKAALKKLANPGVLITAIEGAYWGYKAYPYIKAYLDPPRLLEELQRSVGNSAKGYDVHHIVERTSAKRAGYPRQMIEAPENLVRIPTLKHWQITGWYMTPNDDFGGLSPREYLHGKNWSERLRVGRQALIRYGVLKP